MFRNLTVVLMLVAVLAVSGGLTGLALGADRDEEIEALQDSVTRLKKALDAERKAHAAATKRAAMAYGDMKSIRAALTELSKNLESSMAMTKQLGAEKTNLAQSLSNARESVRTLKMEHHDATVQIRRLENMSKHYALLIKDLRAAAATRQGGVASKPVAPPVKMVSGKITAVSGGVASVNIGRVKGVKEKMVLKIYRDGKFVTDLRVDLVEPDAAAGVLRDKNIRVMQGDEVRLEPAKAKPRVDSSKRMGFAYGGAPAIDRPPLARGDKEKQALATLAEMASDKWYLNVTTREGRMLRQLVEAGGAKRVVEIGTSSGYSTIWLALGVRAAGGRVYTHEIDPKMIKLARANFKKAGVDDLITIIPGDAHKTIKQHKKPIDAVFFDAEKKGYVSYLAAILPLVRPGGLILGHDMRLPKPDPRYIKAITTNPDLNTSFIMMEGFGISVTTKKR
jgi:caffeoyl-CoA O-methyltransferase